MKEQDGQKKLKVYIADGDREALQLCKEQLAALGNEIVGIATDGVTAIEQIICEMPDVVLCEAYLPGVDALGVLDSVREKGFTGVFVVSTFTNNERLMAQLLDAGMDYFLLRPFDYRYFQRRMYALVEEKAKPTTTVLQNIAKVNDRFDLEACISDLMRDIGMPAHIRGYKYVRKAILLALDNSDILNSITKELYPTVAKSYKTTASRVERAIRHAIEVAWQRGDIEVLNSLFGYTIKNSKGKPTNGEFISLVADRIRLDLKIS